MTSKWKTALWIFLYSVAVGALLAAFSYTPGIVKYVFSLLALYLIIRFFRQYETWPVRILFIAQSIIMYLLGAVITAMIIYYQSEGVPAP
ncbi:hypothetical protein ACFSL6_00780 [Paenibacillus thailandensis]|uniref:Histidine kinase n=1 Tax=Paenibacillus thailandensis TaxID=393250 RepID=A0ABW5QXP1_9BACL